MNNIAIIEFNERSRDIYNRLKDNENNHIYVLDEKRGLRTDLSKCNYVFLCCSLDTLSDNFLDYRNLINIIDRTNDEALIFLRSRTLFNSITYLENKTNRKIHFFPYMNELENNRRYFIGDLNFKLKKEIRMLFSNRITLSSIDNNSMEALKHIYDISIMFEYVLNKLAVKFCDNMKCDYESILNIMKFRRVNIDLDNINHYIKDMCNITNEFEPLFKELESLIEKKALSEDKA